METDTIHPAEAYLRNENNPSSLYVKIEGKRRRLFINRNENVIGIIALGKRKEVMSSRTGRVSKRYITRLKNRKRTRTVN